MHLLRVLEVKLSILEGQRTETFNLPKSIFEGQKTETFNHLMSILEGQKREGIQKDFEGTEQNTSHGFWCSVIFGVQRTETYSEVLKSWNT
jgi:hypothetical protein